MFLFFLCEKAAEQRQVLIFSYTPLCISLPSVRDGGLFMISKEGLEVELFWLQGRRFFYTDLPDTDACILLFGLFFNLNLIFCVRPTCLRPAWPRLPRVVRRTQYRIALIFALNMKDYDQNLF